MRLHPHSSTALATAGAILVALGLYFAFVRPALLPEDARFMGASPAVIQAALPGLSLWLQRVFWVMGGFMFSAGVLTCYLAFTAFRQRAPGSAVVVALAGLASIGTMAAVNFAIASDFRWLIRSFAVPWASALALYWRETSQRCSSRNSSSTCRH